MALAKWIAASGEENGPPYWNLKRMLTTENSYSESSSYSNLKVANVNVENDLLFRCNCLGYFLCQNIAKQRTSTSQTLRRYFTQKFLSKGNLVKPAFVFKFSFILDMAWCSSVLKMNATVKVTIQAWTLRFVFTTCDQKLRAKSLRIVIFLHSCCLEKREGETRSGIDSRF